MTGDRAPQVILLCVVGVTAIVLTVPTLIVIGASFTAGEIVVFPPQGFSLRWYVDLLAQRELMGAFRRSLWVAALATAIMLPAGTLAALALARHRLRGASAIRLYLMLPFTVPVVAAGIGMLSLFGSLDAIGALWPIAIAIAATNVPFVLWSVGASANALDPDLEAAAANCGAPPWRVFVTVTLPAVMPGIITGGLLCFVVSFNEFVVGLFLVEKRINTLPVEIYGAVRSLVTPDIAAVSVVYIAVAAVAVVVVDRLVGLELFLRSR